MRPAFDVRLVVFLDCTPEVALARKLLAEAGAGHEDRGERDDAALATFERKVRSFDEETRPLLAWYADRGVPIARVSVAIESTPAEMADLIAADLDLVRPFMTARWDGRDSLPHGGEWLCGPADPLILQKLHAEITHAARRRGTM